MLPFRLQHRSVFIRGNEIPLQFVIVCACTFSHLKNRSFITEELKSGNERTLNVYPSSACVNFTQLWRWHRQILDNFTSQVIGLHKQTTQQMRIFLSFVHKMRGSICDELRFCRNTLTVIKMITPTTITLITFKIGGKECPRCSETTKWRIWTRIR